MRSIHLAFISGLVTVVAWAAKAVAIGLAGGLGLSPFEGPLFFLGLAAALTGVVALALHFTHQRSGWVRAGAGIGAVVTMFLVAFGVLAILLALRTSGHWAWDEANLWVVALVLLVLTSWAMKRKAVGVAGGPSRPSRIASR